MTAIRLMGLAKPSDGTNKEHIERLTGFTLVRDNDDWIIPANDPVLKKGPSDILVTTDRPWQLEPGSHSQIARKYVADFLVPYFEERLTPPKEKVTIFGEWGIRTPLQEQQLNFFFTPAAALASRLEQETLLFFVDQLHASTVVPVLVRADLQQAFLSIAKILALIQYTGVEKATDHISKEKQLNAALPTSLDMLSYLEALNTMSPAAMTMPIHRVGSSLHFMAGRPWFFPRLAVTNIYEQLLSDITPVVGSGVAFFTKDQHLQKRAIHAYFSTAIEGINRLMRYLNDVRTHVDAAGTFDPMRMVKAHSVVRLMFADWQSVNFTNSRYMQVRMVFAFIDKLANFLAMMKRSSTSEEDLFKRLCAEPTGRLLADVLRDRLGGRFHSLGRLMSTLAKATYENIHRHISSQLRVAGDSEVRRLSYLRTLRNSAHGAFLRSRQFEEVFLAAGGTICAEFAYLPLLLLWGLVSDPDRFINGI